MPEMPKIPEPASELAPDKSSLYGPVVPGLTSGPGFQFQIDTGDESRGKLSTTVELVLFITLLTLAPAIVLSMTSFTRIIIVLSFMKRAMSIQEMPPNHGRDRPRAVPFALHHEAGLHGSVRHGAQTLPRGTDRHRRGGRTRERSCLELHARPDAGHDLELMYRIARTGSSRDGRGHPASTSSSRPSSLSEIKTAFQMGFVSSCPSW